MTTSTIITMIFTMGIIWGGFLLLAITALRKESGKDHGVEEETAYGSRAG